MTKTIWRGAVLAVVLALSVALSAAIAAATKHHKPLISNGSFELPKVSPQPFLTYNGGSKLGGWKVGGQSVQLIGPFWPAAKGKQSVDLSGNGPGSIAQTVRTKKGAQYVLSWYMAGNPDGGDPIKVMNVFWDGVLVASPTFNTTGHSNQHLGWVRMHMTVIATGAWSSVKFADATPDQSPWGATVDAVSLRRS